MSVCLSLHNTTTTTTKKKIKQTNQKKKKKNEKRGYNAKKIEENVTAEIMQVVLDEARESYHPSVVMELQSNRLAEMEQNVCTIANWLLRQTPEEE